MKHSIKPEAFLPKYLNNALLANVWNLMRKWQRMFRNHFSDHLPMNEEAFSRHLDNIKKSGGYIEDQQNYTDMAYGKTTMQYAGCAVFAAYNAIFHITGQTNLPLPQFIAEFEQNGIVWSGRLGTSPHAVKDFLDRHGFQTLFTTVPSEFDTLDRQSKSLILTIYNNRDDIRCQIHTLHISKENGTYTAHNAYCDGRIVGPCNSLPELMGQLQNGKAKAITLLGIKADTDNHHKPSIS